MDWGGFSTLAHRINGLDSCVLFKGAGRQANAGSNMRRPICLLVIRLDRRRPNAVGLSVFTCGSTGPCRPHVLVVLS